MIGKSTSTLAGVCNCHSSSRNISFWIWCHNHPCTWVWISLASHH
jgi:hypothetical protein